MPAVSPIVHARSAQVGIGERDSRRACGQQLVVRGQLHSPMGKLVMRVAHVAPNRARCFNSKRTSFHVALELEHVESVDLRSAIRKADAVLPAFAREGQRGHTLKRVARRGRCRLLFVLGVQHITNGTRRAGTHHTAAVKNRHRERYPRAKGLRVGVEGFNTFHSTENRDNFGFGHLPWRSPVRQNPQQKATRSSVQMEMEDMQPCYRTGAREAERPEAVRCELCFGKACFALVSSTPYQYALSPRPI